MKWLLLFNMGMSAIMSIISYIFGGVDKAFIVLISVIIIDFITGICEAIYNKKLSSIIGFKGIIKKVGYLIIVALAVLIDKIVGNGSMVRMMVIYFFVANEGISILENWAMMGLPLPPKIFELLNELKEGEYGSKASSQKQDS